MGGTDLQGGQNFFLLFADCYAASCWSAACELVCVGRSHGKVVPVSLWILQAQSGLAEPVEH